MWEPFGQHLGREFPDHFKKPIESFKRQTTVRLFSPGELHVDAHLVPFLEEFLRLFCAKFKVVLSCRKPNAQALYLDLFLFFALFPLALFPLVLELSKIHDFTDRWAHGGSNFDKIQSSLLGNLQGLGCFQNSEVFPLLINDADRGDTDVLIYAITSLDMRYRIGFTTT